MNKTPADSFKWLFVLAAVFLAVSLLLPQAGFAGKDSAGKNTAAQNPRVLLETTMGPIQIELWKDQAPLTTANFLQYVDDGFYNGKIFHRVINGFMIQGGGFSESMSKGQTRAPIKNEAKAHLKNKRGTIAMARTSQVDSATAQFFINLVDNTFLDHKDNSSRGFGYAAFGEVVSGMDTVDKIAKVRTSPRGGHQNAPVTPVVILTATRVQPAAGQNAQKAKQ